MNYLDRPVFLFAPDWSQSVNKPFTYDLAALNLGFGAEVFMAAQQYTVQGYEVTVLLRTADDIQDFDDFTAALAGRLIGFWFPAPLEAGAIVNVVDTTHFDIVDQQLAETWDDNPDQYLIFTKPGQNPVAAKITDVTDLGTGRERITINAAVAFLDTSSFVRRLHYVRLADDVERAKFIAEGVQYRNVRVIELPFEYAAAETGERPIYLYKFWFEAPIGVTWRFTSFASDVASNGILFTRSSGTSSISHGSRRNTIRGDDSLDITAALKPWSANHPFATMLDLVPITGTLHVQVIETTFADPDTAAPIFTGRVMTVSEEEDGKLVGKCETWGEILRRKIGRASIQEQCNNHLGDFGCKVNLARYQRTAQIVSVTGNVIVVSPNTAISEGSAEDYFAQGWIEVGAGVQHEIRTVLASTWNGVDEELTLTLNVGLVHAQAGDRIDLTPGCDGAAQTCKDKFDNFVNFGGFVAIPARNLALKAMDIPQNEGGKK